MSSSILNASKPLTGESLADVAAFFCHELEGPEKAMLFLRKVLNTIESLSSSAATEEGGPASGIKRMRGEEAEEGSASTSTYAFPPPSALVAGGVTLRGDTVDELPVTLIMQVPEDITLISHLIGKGGSSINAIIAATG